MKDPAGKFSPGMLCDSCVLMPGIHTRNIFKYQIYKARKGNEATNACVNNYLLKCKNTVVALARRIK